MKIICSWCQTTIKDFGGKPGLSTGICHGCRAKFFPETLRTVQENGKAILAECLRAIGEAS